MTLHDAVTLAMKLHRGGDLAGAERIYRGVLDLAPGMPAALHFLGLLLHGRGQASAGLALIERSLALSGDEVGWWGNYAEALVAGGRDEEAEVAYLRGVAIDPGDPRAYPRLEAFLTARGRIAELARLHSEHVIASPNGRHASELGRAFARLNRMSEAQAQFRRWLDESPGDPVAAHLLRATSGDFPERCDDAYVATSFDSYAERFDEHIVTLDYRGPSLAAAALERAYGAPAGRLQALDAGCGTGLCAAVMRPYAQRLVGVDLSEKMLEKAQALGLYDDLTCAELTQFLQGCVNAFDLILSADTLCYFGSLAPALDAAHRALRPGGRLIFTLEADEACEGFKLGHSGRYQHNSRHVRRVAEAGGFLVEELRAEKLRDEGGMPVAGILAALRRV
jgi:predicted TPR repeat methyltransferase